MKYKVTVNILTSDKEGNFKSKDYDYNFKDENIFKARKKAIAKVKELENEFAFGDENYDSPLVAQLKNFKDFKAYSINLLFLPENGYGGCLYGEGTEETIETLQSEVYHYAEQDDIPQTEIEYQDGEWDCVHVIEEDLDFIL
ncbi:hypothetical protein N9R06_00510 [Algibacter sp.]|nr:hypothetical protein [Algibacter sp.]